MHYRHFFSVSVLAVGLILGGCAVTEDNGYEVGVDWEAVGLDNGENETRGEGASDRRLEAASAGVAEEDVTFTVETDHDVDTVYARIRRAFNFQTLDEREPSDDLRRELIKMDDGYHHRMTPGVQYSLREMQEIDGHRAVMQIDIDREGEGSRLYVGYYTGDDAFPEGESFRERVKSRIRQALD